uniref:Reverse transcriptase zinc-binding domain-containing protein n=1 Tax=Cannabis sativa TaxID=3483 RepID=A0A803P096_CANSA
MLSNFFNERGELMIESLAEWFNPRVGSQIGRVELLSNGDKDNLIWRDSTDGSFTVSQAYLSLIKPRLGRCSNVWKEIWKAPVHERVKLFLWKVCKDILPCGSRLRTVFGNESHCTMCSDGEDSIPHLFFQCPFARACWFSSPFGIRSEGLVFGNMLELVNWIIHSPPNVPPCSPGGPSFPQFAAYLCYSLWNARNKVFHNGSALRPQDVLSNCLKLMNDFTASKSRISLERLEVLHHPCQPQLVPKDFNFFSDAAVRGSCAFVAVVVFNKEGAFVEALTAKVSVSSALHAESLALCHAFSLSLKMNCKDASFYTDCLQLANAVKNYSISVWNLSNIFLHLFSCLKLNTGLGVFWLPREANLAAHKLAAWAALNNVSRVCTAGEVAPFVATGF